MRFRLRAIALAALGVIALAATPAQANRSESKDVSVYAQLESLASAARHAAAHVLEGSTRAMAETKSKLAPHLQTFANVLTEQKARLAMIGTDAATQLKTWRQATEQSWSDIQRAVDDALDRLRGWIGPSSVPDQQAEIHV